MAVTAQDRMAIDAWVAAQVATMPLPTPEQVATIRRVVAPTVARLAPAAAQPAA